MWYVIQVQARHEMAVCERMRKDVLKDGEEAFVLLSERIHRRQPRGYEIVLTPAFQKYIFADIGNVGDFQQRLRSIKEMTKLLAVGDDIVPIREDEQRLLELLSDEQHVIRISTGYIAGEKVTVTDGPLKGRSGLVQWTNPRQKLVGIKLQLFGREARVKLGMEYIAPANAG